MHDERDELLEEIERELKGRADARTADSTAREENERVISRVAAAIDLARAHGVIRYPQP